jgi:hypothetical protein
VDVPDLVLGFRATHVVSKPKKPEFRMPAQVRYDAEMRGDEQSFRLADFDRVLRACQQIIGVQP